MKQSGRLERSYGPWAVVTGASDRIGRAFACEAARSGLHVVLGARRKNRLNSLVEENQAKHKVQTMVLARDLSRESGIDVVVNATKAMDAGLLVAAAGFGTSGPILEANLDEERSMLQLNCYALLALSVPFNRQFAKRRRGGMILMSSLVDGRALHSRPTARLPRLMYSAWLRQCMPSSKAAESMFWLLRRVQ